MPFGRMGRTAARGRAPRRCDLRWRIGAIMLCALSAGPVRAQGPQMGISRAAQQLGIVPSGEITALAFGIASDGRSDRRFAGMVIGGAALGVAGGLLLHWACTNYGPDADSSCVGETLAGAGVGGALGGLLGYLVGLGIPAGPSESGQH